MEIITIVLTSISLSMDAFSLSLIYGTYITSKKDKFLLSTIVGIYHFFMPLIGNKIGNLIISKIIINLNILVSIIFIFLSVEMILNNFNKKEIKFKINYFSYILFGLSVSIDSLTVGIGLSAITNKYILSSVIFALFSFSFTLFGNILGNKINNRIGKNSTVVGGVLLFFLGILYLLKIM